MARKQKFKTARELRCSDEDREAAITVLGMMERQKLVQVTPRSSREPNGFNMSIWRDEHKCGTVGCIGGWIEKIKGASLNAGAMTWNDLFCPPGFSHKSRTFTIERCAKALRAKLTTGHADWSR